MGRSFSNSSKSTRNHGGNCGRLTAAEGRHDGPVSFEYDGDQQRIHKRTPDGSTLYFEGLYERVTLATGVEEHRYYVNAGSATVVVTRKAGEGKGNATYLLTEALGSTDVVVSHAGVVVQRRSHDAFGARRSPQWGKPHVGPFLSKASPMGFTEHEEDEVRPRTPLGRGNETSSSKRAIVQRSGMQGSRELRLVNPRAQAGPALRSDLHGHAPRA